MYSCLCPHAVNTSFDSLESLIAAAKSHGFGGVQVNAGEVAARVEADGLPAVKALFEDAGVKAGAFGLPVNWAGDEAAYNSGLEHLPHLAELMAAIGATRTFFHLWPFSDTLGFDANWAFHVERFTPIANILAEHGVSLGFEFLGPKTLRDGHKYEFVHTMDGMLDLAAAVGPNVGLLLDCWHWHTSGATVADIRKLKPEQVVFVHVNDAPAGIPNDQQQDTTRKLPGATGVIDIAGFLQALRDIGYTGPVTPEPFEKQLKELPDDDARLSVVSQAMDDVFARAFGAPAGS